MSQRLLISLKKNVKKEDSFYDCIYTEEGNLQILLTEWLQFNPETGFCFGPWKICIRDKSFFDKFMSDFSKIKNFCPALSSFDDVWTIYENEQLVHESKKESTKFNKIIKSFIKHIKKYNSLEP